MNRRFDIDHALQAWLEDGPNQLPGRVLDVTAAEIDDIPQRRPSWLSRGKTADDTVNRTAISALGVAVALVLSIGVYGSIAGAPTSDGPGATNRQSMSPTAREPVFEVALHYYTTDGDRGGILARVPEPTRIQARLPEGWVSTGSSITNDPDEPDEAAIAISFWAVDAVFIEPCRAEGDHTADPPLMRTLDGLALAFTAWWQTGAADVPSATDPVATTLGGFDARYLELRMPDAVDVGGCVGGRYATWRNAEGVERLQQAGDVTHMWIVQLGPHPDLGSPRNMTPVTSAPLLVIDATSRGEPSPEALAELEKVIDALHIEAPREIPQATGAIAPPVTARAPSECGFPPGTVLAFAGEASLKEAGLLDTKDQPGQNWIGDLYVTADPISIDMDPNSTRRRFCMLYQGRSSAHGPVGRGWEFPSP